jgi:hypothetical protein
MATSLFYRAYLSGKFLIYSTRDSDSSQKNWERGKRDGKDFSGTQR